MASIAPVALQMHLKHLTGPSKFSASKSGVAQNSRRARYLSRNPYYTVLVADGEKRSPTSYPRRRPAMVAHRIPMTKSIIQGRVKWAIRIERLRQEMSHEISTTTSRRRAHACCTVAHACGRGISAIGSMIPEL